MKPTQISKNEYAPFYQPYMDALEENCNLIDELEISLYRTIQFIQDVPLDKFDYRYAEGKWTIKEIIQHIIDAERVFSYRALRFSRNDKTALPGYDENAFAAAVNTTANKRHLQDLLSELSAVRQSTIALFKSFTPDDFLKIGVASEREMSVRAIGFIIIGHQNHHVRIFKQRYLE